MLINKREIILLADVYPEGWEWECLNIIDTPTYAC